MDAIDFLPGPDWTPEQDSNFIDLTVREHLLDLHERLLDVWDDSEEGIESLTQEELAYHLWLGETFEADVGVHPRNRMALREELAKAMQDRYRRSLADVLRVVNSQSSNASL